MLKILRIEEEAYIFEYLEKRKLLKQYIKAKSNKFEIKYDIHKPITPYIAFEIRYQIRNPRLVEADYGFHRNRYFVGLDYKRNDKHSFGLYYMIQQEYFVSAPQNLYIVGLEYGLSL